jgi:mono/diheme cytochrome c family protein
VNVAFKRLPLKWIACAFPAAAALAIAAVSPLAQAQSSAAPKSYAAACQSCHKADGSGMAGVFPRLTGRLAPATRGKDGRTWLISTLLYGQSGEITVDGKTIRGAMPGASRLADSDIADILNWLAGKPAKAFTAAEVAAVRSRSGITARQVADMRAALASAGTLK